MPTQQGTTPHHLAFVSLLAAWLPFRSRTYRPRWSLATLPRQYVSPHVRGSIHSLAGSTTTCRFDCRYRCECPRDRLDRTVWCSFCNHHGSGGSIRVEFIQAALATPRIMPFPHHQLPSTSQRFGGTLSPALEGLSASLSSALSLGFRPADCPARHPRRLSGGPRLQFRWTGLRHNLTATRRILFAQPSCHCQYTYTVRRLPPLVTVSIPPTGRRASPGEPACLHPPGPHHRGVGVSTYGRRPQTTATALLRPVPGSSAFSKIFQAWSKWKIRIGFHRSFEARL